MEDVSKTTLAILLVLTIILSIIGTWTTISTLNKVGHKEEQKYNNNGIVSLTIAKPQDEGFKEARVSLSIVKEEKGG
ncbi:MAG: hypothetical protein QXU20_01430 [Candidatus Woesearchaeota archaeon]